MLIPDKKSFLKEVNELENEQLKSKLIDLYEHLLGTKVITDASKVIEDVITEMFSINYSEAVKVPWEFHGTVIAKVIFPIYYGFNEVTYTIQDIRKFTISDKKPEGFTKQYLKEEMDKGNLVGTFNNGRWNFTKSQVNSFLIYKGINPIE